MATDYEARKAAKSNRKRSSSTPKRERKKKNQPRRLCRGPCFKPPGLDAEDSDQEAPSRRTPSGRGELAKYANLTFGDNSTGSRKRRDSKSTEAQQSERKAKKPKLSTQVQLIAPKTDSAARKAAAAAKKDHPAAATDLSTFPEQIQSFFAGERLTTPMPVQELCWPHLLAGRDVEAVAEPGSGKTIAYLLPAAVALAEQGHSGETAPETPLVLILLPTRELAQQVAGVCKTLRRHCGGLRSVCLTGGAEIDVQVAALEKRPHILVATPGRLLDLIDSRKLSLDSVQYVVLDEADKMLGMGFAPQIERIKSMLGVLSSPASTKKPIGKESSRKKVSDVRKRPQVGLFTATMPPAVRAVADEWLINPERVAVASSASGAAPGRAISSTVVQVVQVCAEHKKPAKLLKHLESIKSAAAAAGLRHAPRVLIFSNRIKTVRFLSRQVAKAGFRAAELHGERSQDERDKAVKDFKSGKAQVLVASDVAARGLDIQNLPYVVNYDFPANLETYVHRVGRTGRLAADGHAFSFLTREMAPLAGPLLRLLRDHDQSIDPNVVKLSEAYEVAAEKLGLPVNTGYYGAGTDGTASASAGEDGAAVGGGGESDYAREKALRPATDDVLRELDMKSKIQKKKDRVAEAKRDKKRKAEKKEPETESDSEVEDASDEDKVATRNGIAKKKAAAAPEFVPYKKFSGARPGYVFKKGGLGVGYYLDNPPHAHLKALAAARKELAAKMARKPIGGSAAAASKPGNPATKAVPLLPGRLKALKKKQGMDADYSSEGDSSGSDGAVAGKHSNDGSSDSDSEPEPEQASKGKPAQKKGSAVTVASPGGVVKRRGSLPGRLRKKLAKDKLRKGAAA